jgi:hypothetical protein
MTEIERKALALAIEARVDDAFRLCPDPTLTFSNWEALCRAIEQHEAFKQEVSDALVDSWYHNASGKLLERFIIHKPKPDPLVAVVYEVDNGPAWDSPEDYCNKIRVALEARGLEIREKGQ